MLKKIYVHATYSLYIFSLLFNTLKLKAEYLVAIYIKKKQTSELLLTIYSPRLFVLRKYLPISNDCMYTVDVGSKSWRATTLSILLLIPSGPEACVALKFNKTSLLPRSLTPGLLLNACYWKFMKGFVQVFNIISYNSCLFYKEII